MTRSVPTPRRECLVLDTIALFWLCVVTPFISENDHLRAVKTLRLQLRVLDPAESAELLDLVTTVDGVLAALVDATNATLEVVVSSEASALHVREQLWSALRAHAAA